MPKNALKLVEHLGPEHMLVKAAQDNVTQAETKISPLAVSKDRVSLENKRHLLRKKRQEMEDELLGSKQNAQKEI